MMNVGILGAGKIAHKMAQTLRMMAENGEAVGLYAVSSRYLEKAKLFAEQEGFAKYYGSYEEMLEDPAVDLVYIATPHSHHAEQIRMCVKHRKAVLCEKAFTANARLAREVLAEAEAAGVLVTEAIWTRYMPYRPIINELIASGKLGKVHYISANLGYDIWRNSRLHQPDLCGGALLDVGIYPLNFAAMVWPDDPVSVTGTMLPMSTGVDMSENITLTWADGRIAALQASAYCLTDRHAVICGTEGRLELDNVNNPTVLTWYPADRSGAQPSEQIPLPKHLTGYEYEVRACMKALEEGRIECPEMPHAETIRMMAQMDALRAQWGVVYPYD